EGIQINRYRFRLCGVNNEMPFSPEITKLLVLAPLAAFVTYYDLRYRRIPNLLILATLVSGLTLNIIFSGAPGALSSIEGFGVAFFPMFLMHLFGAMGAGDVKLFGAIGAVLGVGMVPMAFVVVVMFGAALAVYSMLRSGTVFSTLHGVLRIFVGILPGWEMPRFAIPPDRRHTIPYGVAITLGSLITAVAFKR
ncbi:MAG TPA: A24 family peptidase, partial [Pyrinomonadaceae bacterium]|nr:A24 family peptidase [Pyrinomonadaceae bacterium]